MQHKPLENVHPVTVAHAESTPAPVDRGIFTGTSGQGSALPDTEARTHQYQPCHSSHAAQDACSAQDSHSTSTGHPRQEQADMDTSPSTPPGRGIPMSSARPPDAPRKLKQTRPPIQLSPNAPVRKLDFDCSLLHMQSSSDSEQSCNSRHSGPRQG